MPSKIDILNTEIERKSISGANLEELAGTAKSSIRQMMEEKKCVEFDTDYLGGKKVNKLCYDPNNGDLYLCQVYSDEIINIDVEDMTPEDIMTLWNWVRDIYDGVY